MDSVIQAVLGVVQGLFGFLFSIVMGFLEAVFGTLLSVIGAPKTIPDQALAMIHSAAIAIDTVIPMPYFLSGLSGIFVAYCLKWGTELMLLPISLAKFLMHLIATIGGNMAKIAAAILAWV